MKLLSLTVVKNRDNDWEGVYDQYGTLVYQNETIDWEYVLSNNVCKVSSIKYVDNDWLNSWGILPNRLSEVMFESDSL